MKWCTVVKKTTNKIDWDTCVNSRMTNFQGHLPKTALTHPRQITQTQSAAQTKSIILMARRQP